jgi:hypothetical protein
MELAAGAARSSHPGRTPDHQAAATSTSGGLAGHLHISVDHARGPGGTTTDQHQ